MLRVTQPVLYDYRSTEEFLLHSLKYLLFLSLQQVNILAFRGMKTVFTSWFSQEISCTRVRRIQHGIGHDYWWEQSVSVLENVHGILMRSVTRISSSLLLKREGLAYIITFGFQKGTDIVIILNVDYLHKKLYI